MSGHGHRHRNDKNSYASKKAKRQSPFFDKIIDFHQPFFALPPNPLADRPRVHKLKPNMPLRQSVSGNNTEHQHSTPPPTTANRWEPLGPGRPKCIAHNKVAPIDNYEYTRRFLTAVIKCLGFFFPDRDTPIRHGLWDW